VRVLDEKIACFVRDLRNNDPHDALNLLEWCAKYSFGRLVAQGFTKLGSIKLRIWERNALRNA
jgi:hypothetical protein